MEIHIRRNGKSIGPYSLEEARERLARGDLAPNDESWHPGLTGWKPLSSVVDRSDPTSSRLDSRVGRAVPTQEAIQPRKFRMGCCGWLLVCLLFGSAMMAYEYLTEEKTESVSNGVATIKVTEYDASGKYENYGQDRDAFARQIAKTVWESANAHPEVHTVNVQVYGRYPERTNTDHYGNQNQVAAHSVHLCDFVISDLADIRRYKTKEDYGIDDSRYSFQQKIEPSYRIFWNHIKAQDY